MIDTKCLLGLIYERGFTVAKLCEALEISEKALLNFWIDGRFPKPYEFYIAHLLGLTSDEYKKIFK